MCGGHGADRKLWFCVSVNVLRIFFFSLTSVLALVLCLGATVQVGAIDSCRCLGPRARYLCCLVLLVHPGEVLPSGVTASVGVGCRCAGVPGLCR